MLGRKVHQVNDAHGFASPIINHHAHLFVGINVVSVGLYVFVQSKARIRNVCCANGPKCLIVLYFIKRVEVFGFHRAQVYYGMVHLIMSLVVISNCVSGLKSPRVTFF